MTTQEAIEAVIREDVRCDIHGDLYGVDRASEYIAGVIDEKCARIEFLERSLTLISGYNEHNHPCKKEIDNVICDALGE